MTKPKKLDIYEVIWQDSSSCGRWRGIMEQVAIARVVPTISSVGYLLESTPEAMSLLQNYDDRPFEEQLTSECITIPVGCIVSYRKLS